MSMQIICIRTHTFSANSLKEFKQLRGRRGAQTEKCVNGVKGNKAGVEHEVVQFADCELALFGLLICCADPVKSSESLDFGIELHCGFEFGGGHCR